MKKAPFIIQVITDLANISSAIKNDEAATKWLNTSNANLGHKEPIELIFEGQTDKVIKQLKIDFSLDI